MTVYVVYHDWEENSSGFGGDEFSVWHHNMIAIFSTEELAEAYCAREPYKETSNYVISGREVHTELIGHIRTEEEFRQI